MTRLAHNRGSAVAGTTAVLALAVGLATCGGEGARGDATGTRPEGVSALFEPLPAAAEHPADNPGTPERIDLGHKLFFEPRISRSGIISCNTCHVVGAAGVDSRAVAIGEGARTGPRNSPTVFNAAFLATQFWDGRAPTLEEQAKGPIQAHVEIDLTPEEAVERLGETGYAPYFAAAFPGEAEPLMFDNLAHAIAALERTRYVLQIAPLRNVALTSPYFHDGSAATLHEAVSVMGSARNSSHVASRNPLRYTSVVATSVATTAPRLAAASASGNCVVTWSMRSPPHASDDSIVVSEIGEHWSPKTAPPSTAPKQSERYVGSGLTAHASGIASGKTTAYVPQEEPIEKATAMQIPIRIAGSRVGCTSACVLSTM